jgi:hypothetical protein
LWYLWKARNDLRFQKKKWTVLQVHHAVEADLKISLLDADKIKTNSTNNQQGKTNSFFAGIQTNERASSPNPNHKQTCSDPTPEYSICRLPSLIAGSRCYVDASITPDGYPNDARSAGLGIFFLDSMSSLRCYIKAKATQVTSVLMAESAALALPAMICSRIGVSEISFLTDNQILANFFNGTDYDSPPNWEIKPLTQNFLNATAQYKWRIFKIQRELNGTAHVLASQVFRSSLIPASIAQISCTNANHQNSCPLRKALTSVTWGCFSLVAASCC